MRQIHFQVLLVLFVAGCVPYPHNVTRVPEISATLAKGSEPIPGANVLIGTNSGYLNPCKGAAAVGRTDNKGSISIPPQVETEFFYSLLNPPDTVGQLINICFELPNQPAILGAQFVFKQKKPPAYSLLCDPIAPKGHSAIAIGQICR